MTTCPWCDGFLTYDSEHSDGNVYRCRDCGRVYSKFDAKLKDYVPTLEALSQRIKNEVPDIDRRPYSHNIVGLLLSMVAKHYGDTEANKIIRKHRLDRKGWRVSG